MTRRLIAPTSFRVLPALAAAATLGLAQAAPAAQAVAAPAQPGSVTSKLKWRSVGP